MQVRDTVAVGAEDDRLPVRHPRGLHVLRPVVGERLDGARGRVDPHEVEPAAGQQARGHDRVAGRAPARPAPLDPGHGRGEGLEAAAVEADREQLRAVPPLAREDDPPPVGGDVGVVGAHAAREAADAAARHVHEAEVAEDRERRVHLQLRVDERLAVRRPGEAGAAVAQGEAAVLRAVGAREADLREARERPARVGHPRAVGAEAGRDLADAAPGHGAGRRQAPRLPLAGVPLGRLGGLRGPRRPVGVEAGAGDLAHRAPVEEGRELPGVLAAHLRDRVLARLLGQPAQERLAEQVRDLAAGPVLERVDRLVLLREAPLERRHADHHLRVGVPPAAEGGELGLLVGGEALDHPRHGEGVREEERRAAEDLPPEAPQPARLLEVHGVGQLVGQDEAQPALEVAEVVGAVGRHRADGDEGERQGRGEAVRLVVGVHDHDLDAADLLPVARLVPGQDLGRHRGGLARHRLEALVEVHGHAVGGHGLEVVLGRVGGGLRDARREDEEEEGGEERQEGGWVARGHVVLSVT